MKAPEPEARGCDRQGGFSLGSSEHVLTRPRKCAKQVSLASDKGASVPASTSLPGWALSGSGGEDWEAGDSSLGTAWDPLLPGGGSQAQPASSLGFLLLPIASSFMTIESPC